MGRKATVIATALIAAAAIPLVAPVRAEAPSQATHCTPGALAPPYTPDEFLRSMLVLLFDWPPKRDVPVVHSYPGDTYTNPVIEMPDGDVADPDVVFHDGTWYLYTSRYGGPERGYRVYTSTDLVAWSIGPDVFDPPGTTSWAPDVYRHPDDGRFYLYYTTDEKVGVASSAGPLGPFEDHGILVRQGIDAEVFRDGDGRLFLFYSTLDLWETLRRFGLATSIYGIEMASPTELTPAKPRRVLAADQPWERTNAAFTWGVAEAPHVLERDGRYLMTYSANGFTDPRYNVGVAWADSPLGPYEKSPCNPIVDKGDNVYGPGHHTFAETPDGSLWMVYHAKRFGRRGDGWRDIYVDPVAFDGDEARVVATRGIQVEKPNP